MPVKQFQRPGLNAGKRSLIHTGKFQRNPRGSCRMTVAGSAFVRFRQELLQQTQIAGVMEFHKLCPIFQFRGGDARESFHVCGVLCFVLQKRNKKPLAFEIIRLRDTVNRAVGRGPAAGTVPAEGQIIHPSSKYEALEQVDGIFRRSARQLHAVDGGNRVPPDIWAIISLGFPEKRVVAFRFKHRLKPLR